MPHSCSVSLDLSVPLSLSHALSLSLPLPSLPPPLSFALSSMPGGGGGGHKNQKTCLIGTFALGMWGEVLLSFRWGKSQTRGVVIPPPSLSLYLSLELHPSLSIFLFPPLSVSHPRSADSPRGGGVGCRDIVCETCGVYGCS